MQEYVVVSEGIDFGIPKEMTLDEITDENYSATIHVYNPSKDKIEDLWNGKFMRDSTKMLNGERITQIVIFALEWKIADLEVNAQVKIKGFMNV